IGAVVAPPLTIWISEWYGWRWSFVIPGMVGLLWVVIWLAMPKNSSRTARPQVRMPAISLSKLLNIKPVWWFNVIRFLLDPVLYFLMFWIPKYLAAERSVPYEVIGSLFWVPFLALGISNILGGWMSDALIKRFGFGVNKSRKAIMGFAALLTAVAPL